MIICYKSFLGDFKLNSNRGGYTVKLCSPSVSDVLIEKPRPLVSKLARAIPIDRDGDSRRNSNAQPEKLSVNPIRQMHGKHRSQKAAEVNDVSASKSLA